MLALIGWGTYEDYRGRKGERIPESRHISIAVINKISKAPTRELQTYAIDMYRVTILVG